MEVVAFVPARGGSKSIPLKNIKPFLNHPLIYWGLESLQFSDSIDRIIVATDNRDIKETVEEFTFNKVSIYDREPHNARDSSTTEDVMLEYINKFNLGDDCIFILLQITCPFITSEHIEKALCLFKNGSFDSLLSVVRTKRFFWAENGTPLNYDYLNRPLRQNFDGLFVENGGFYINTIKNIKKHSNRLSGKIGYFEMPSYAEVEIDDPDDWIISEYFMAKYLQSSEKKIIKLLLTDVDGVLTDAGMYYDENGNELKKFSTYDGMAFEMLRKAGIKTGILTSDETCIVQRRAEKIKTDYLYQGVRGQGKLEAAQEICRIEGIHMSEIAYIGDDINCCELLENAGISACPANARSQVTKIPGIIQLSSSGGEGVIREFVEDFLEVNSC